MLYAIDFGAGDALVIWGPDGSVKLNMPRVKGGKTKADDFIRKVEVLFSGSQAPAGDIVTESATVGSSGCEVSAVEDLLKRYPERKLYTFSTRTLKNWRMDHDLPLKKPNDHEADAALLYEIAIERSDRLYNWTKPPMPVARIHKSVRPMDKRGYRDERALSYLTQLPEYASLPGDLKETFGDGKKYLAARVIPFLMALEEPALEDERVGRTPRRRYEKVIGLYDRGYPSFYRRNTVDIMQRVAKGMAGVTRMAEVSSEVRKEAWKKTQRDIRHLFHLTYS